MLRSAVEKRARFVTLAIGSAAAWLVFAIVLPAGAQTASTSSTIVSTVGISPVIVPKINVPPINVPKLNVQVQTARQAAGPATGGATAAQWAVSSPSDPEAAEEADPDNPQSAELLPLVARPMGTRSRSSQRPTGILQLISATEPIDPAMGPTFPPPPPERLPLADGQPALQWSNPYETGPAEVGMVTGWRRVVPMGMLPWGPRTPLSRRSVGWGEPLLGTSWLNRPWSAGWFAGAIDGSPLIHGAVKQQPSFYGGYRAGFDYDFYWGVEARLGAASICLSEPGRIGQPGTNDYWNLDLNLHYYPWGDSRWRPFASFGFGLANSAFYDQFNNHYDQVEFATPIGIGLKYRWTNWVAFRADLIDNVAFARGAVDTTNNFSLTCGVEMQFGGVRRSYWPWNPGRVIR